MVVNQFFLEQEKVPFKSADLFFLCFRKIFPVIYFSCVLVFVSDRPIALVSGSRLCLVRSSHMELPFWAIFKPTNMAFSPGSTDHPFLTVALVFVLTV